MNTIIVGVMGKFGSGKDTVAERLVARHGFTRLAFADELRKEVAEEYGVPIALLTDRSIKEVPCELLGGRSPRDVMREHGAWRRDVFGEDYWINKVAAIVHAGDKGSDRFVISDVRLPNEYDWIASEAGLLVRVVRPAQPLMASHSDFTETALDDFSADVELVNRENELEQLFAELDGVAQNWMRSAELAQPLSALIA